MVIEGVRQIFNLEMAVAGYDFHDVTFTKSLKLSTAQETELQLHLRPRKDLDDSWSNGYDFTIYAWSTTEWSEVCQGTVTICCRPLAKNLETTGHVPHEHLFQQQSFRDDSKRCSEAVDSVQYYENLTQFGYVLGPSFQTLQSLRYNDLGVATGKFQLDKWRGGRASTVSAEHVIHPTDLDAVFQLGTTAVSQGSWTKIPTLLPALLERLWVSSDLLLSEGNQPLDVLAKTTWRGFREVEFSIIAMSSTQEPMVYVTGLRQVASSSLDFFETESRIQRLCYRIAWKPAVDMLDMPQIGAIMQAAATQSEKPSELEIDHQELLSVHYVSATLENLVQEDIAKMPKYLQRYVQWMRHTFKQGNYDSLLRSAPQFENLATREQFLGDFAKRSPTAELMIETGKNLMAILTGKRDGLDLLFSSGLAEKHYSNPVFGISYQMIAAFLDLLSHKNPELKILEVGAGTGAATVPILQTLTFENSDVGISRFSEYMFTDISPVFLEKAKERFRAHASRMSYCTLDIEKDVQQQGFEPEKYDVVISSGVLHATSDLSQTLQNTRRLLKPGGKLVLFEPTNPSSCRSGFSFGLIPGWWLAVEFNRFWSPLISDADWNDILKINGFSGTDICIPDYEREEHQTNSILITTAESQGHQENQISAQAVIVVADDSSKYQQQVAQGLRSSLSGPSFYSYTVLPIHKLLLQTWRKTVFVFLVELEDSFFSTVSNGDFKVLKSVVDSADGILWVTQGCGIQASRPDLALATGFGRNVLSEKVNTGFIELALEPRSDLAQTVARIEQILRKTPGALDSQQDSEYIENEGHICVPRLVAAEPLNQIVHEKLIRQKPQLKAFTSDPGRALRLAIATPGHLHTFHFVDDDTYDKPLEDDELELRVKASGVTSEDVMVAAGEIPGNIFGLECAGIVSRVGRRATFDIGDRVMCCTTLGSHNTYARANLAATAKIPNYMPFTEAAGIPVAFCTAYYGLILLAHLHEGESILIHFGAGGIGQAAIQIALRIGADIYTTVGSDEQKTVIMDSYAIPESHIFLSCDISFAAVIRNATKGVDVVLNSLKGEGRRASLQCLAPFGRFIDLSTKFVDSRNDLSTSSFAKNAIFAAVDLPFVINEAKPLIETLMQSVMAFFMNPVQPMRVPVPLRTFSVSEIEDAYRFMQDKKESGKAVIEMDEDGIVPVLELPLAKASSRTLML